MYRVKNNKDRYCNTGAGNDKFPVVDRVFGSNDINVANQYKEWLEVHCPTGSPFFIVETGEILDYV